MMKALDLTASRLSRAARCAHAHAHAAVERLEDRQLFAVTPDFVLATTINPANGNTYHLLAGSTWDVAEARAVTLGGHLVTINDAAEQEFVRATFSAGVSNLWIGLNDLDRTGRYRWVSGEPVTYANWYAGEPNDIWATGEVWGSLREEYGWQWNDLGPDSPLDGPPLGVVEVKAGDDLTGTFAASPASAKSGGVADVSFDYLNASNNVANGPASVSFYLSADAALDDADVLLDTAAGDQPTLAAGQSINFARQLTIPTGTAAGVYRILAKVDPADAVSEGDEANNVVASDAFDVGATRRAVYRAVSGFVRDAAGHRLHGVRVQLGRGASAFTDYDGASRSIDRDGVTGDFYLRRTQVGWNVSVGKTFVRFAPVTQAERPVTATAADLLGGTHVKQMGVGGLFAFDVARRDGGLPAAVEIKGITINGYAAASTDGSIRPHRDLRNDRNSHGLLARVAAPVAEAARARREAALVTTKLSQLGFRNADGTPLTPTEVIAAGSDQEAALKLFQDIVAGYGAADPSQKASVRPPSGRLDAATLGALNGLSPSAPFWTTAPAPFTFPAEATDTWLHAGAAARLRAVAAALPTVANFALGSASPPTGGTDGGAGSRSGVARAGTEFDLRWITTEGAPPAAGAFWEPIEGVAREDVKLLGGGRYAIPDPAELGTRWRYVATYDQARTSAAIDALLGGGRARVHFNDPQILLAANAISVTGGKLKLLRADLVPAAGYDDRLGLRIGYAPA